MCSPGGTHIVSCMHTCACICIYTLTHAHTYTQLHTLTHIHTLPCTYTHIPAHTHTLRPTLMHTLTCVHTLACSHIHTCSHTHTHIHSPCPDLSCLTFGEFLSLEKVSLCKFIQGMYTNQSRAGARRFAGTRVWRRKLMRGCGGCCFWDCLSWLDQPAF